MDPLEQELKAALKKMDPSPFFESRVMAAANRQTLERKATLRMRWLTAILAMALVIIGVFWQHRRAVEEQARGQAGEGSLDAGFANHQRETGRNSRESGQPTMRKLASIGGSR